jgi:hypothetical protein
VDSGQWAQIIFYWFPPTAHYPLPTTHCFGLLTQGEGHLL